MQLPLAPPAPAPAVQLPAIYSRWVEQALGALPPAETLATCEACVKLPAPGEPPGETHYDPRTKCCTYLPVVHNFQVGALLDDPLVPAAGRASVEARIDAEVSVTPIGLMGHPAYYSRYHDQAFGHDVDLLCPHYLDEQGGRCGIWQHRNATCSTWFCRCDRGAASFQFWRAGLSGLLRAVEEVLSDWAVFALGARADDFSPWADRRAFYRASARLAAGCSWEQILALGGARLNQYLEQAQQLHRALLEAPLDPTWEPGRERGEQRPQSQRAEG